MLWFSQRYHIPSKVRDNFSSKIPPCGSRRCSGTGFIRYLAKDHRNLAISEFLRKQDGVPKASVSDIFALYSC